MVFFSNIFCSMFIINIFSSIHNPYLHSYTLQVQPNNIQLCQLLQYFLEKTSFFFTPKVLSYSQFHPELVHFINFIADLFYMRHNVASPQLTDKQKYLNFPSYRECNYHIKVIKLIIF